MRVTMHGYFCVLRVAVAVRATDDHDCSFANNALISSTTYGSSCRHASTSSEARRVRNKPGHLSRQSCPECVLKKVSTLFASFTRLSIFSSQVMLHLLCSSPHPAFHRSRAGRVAQS